MAIRVCELRRASAFPLEEASRDRLKLGIYLQARGQRTSPEFPAVPKMLPYVSAKPEYPSRQVAWAVLVLAVALLTIIGLLAYRATKRLVASEQLVSHTREIQTLLEDISSDVLQASNARRGYIITVSDADLSAYSAAGRDLPGKLKRLQSITADNVSQQQLCTKLITLIQDELSLIEDSIDQRKGAHKNKVRQMRITRAGSAMIDHVFAVIGKMGGEEEQMQVERRKQANAVCRQSVLGLAAAPIVAIFVIFKKFYQLKRELWE